MTRARSSRTRRHALSASITPAQFDNGYWYATELKAFAREIGIPSVSALRKDELEAAITRVLSRGKATKATARARRPIGVRDGDRGLTLDLRVVVYTNDTATKRFLEREAKRRAPEYTRRSGARYRLNRWRDAKLARGAAITYRDVIDEYVRLSRPDTRFAPIPTGRYINFSSEFFARERGATRARALRAWREVKTMNATKTYAAWKAGTSARVGKRRGA